MTSAFDFIILRLHIESENKVDFVFSLLTSQAKFVSAYFNFG